MLTLAEFRRRTADLPGHVTIEINGKDLAFNAEQIAVEIDNDGEGAWVSLNVNG